MFEIYNSFNNLDFGKIDTNHYIKLPYTFNLNDVEDYRLFGNLNNSFISGSLYKFDEENIFYGTINITVESNISGQFIKKVSTSDGTFHIDGLPDNTAVNLIIEIEDDAYKGKIISNIMPTLDYQKYLSIIQVYKTSTESYFKVRYSGIGTLSITGNAELEKVDDYNYKAINITGAYTVTLIDYVNETSYILEKTY